MERVLFALLTVLHPVLTFMSQLPQFGFLLFFLGLWEAMRARFKGMLLYIVMCCLCFFSPNLAVMVERKLASPELRKAYPRGEVLLYQTSPKEGRKR